MDDSDWGRVRDLDLDLDLDLECEPDLDLLVLELDRDRDLFLDFGRSLTAYAGLGNGSAVKSWTEELSSG